MGLNDTYSQPSWMEVKGPPAERLVSFEKWLAKELESKLIWPRDPHRKNKQIHQCKGFVLKFVVELKQRGWLFDGPLLARLINDKLSEIRRTQEKNRVDDLWPFLEAIFDRYAGERAEELKEQSMRTGYHISIIEAGIKTMPQIVAEADEERVRDQAKTVRKRLAKEKAERHQLKLL